MIGGTDLYQKTLVRALSLAATVNRPLTGSFFQETILRMLGVQVAGPVIFGLRPTIRAPGNLRLGRYVSIGDNANLSCWAPVSIGDDFIAPDDLTINSGGHDVQTLQPRNRPVQIGARVWCGVRVTICAGVTIGDDVVIGAGAVVIRSVEPNCVVAGVPARTVRTLQRQPGELWSCWPERNPYRNHAGHSPFKRWAVRMRSRL